MIKLVEALEGLETENIIGAVDKEVESIVYDSRKCGKNKLFAALRGSETDGHNFIGSALRAGTEIILCEEIPAISEEFPEAVYIKVKNSRKALAKISHNFFGDPTKDMKMIGVTGTNGKTTITFLLKSMFEFYGVKAGIIGTTGIYFGDKKIEATHTTPESPELAAHLSTMRGEGIEAVIMEVSSHALHQSRADYIRFDAAIFTNLTHEHLDYHKTMKEYAGAKKILFDMLPRESIAIACDDCEFSDYILSGCRSVKKLFVGRTAKADIRITDEILNIDKTTFKLDFQGKDKSDFAISLMGRFNIDNSAFAAAIAYSMCFPPVEIQNCLSLAKGAPGRMERVRLKNGAVGIVDYSHTPDALEKALQSCREVIDKSRVNSRLISVFGCGGDRDSTKRPLMGGVSVKIADYTIITNDNPRTEDPLRIIDEIKFGINSSLSERYETITDRSEAIKRAYEYSGEKDIILVAGKGHENYQIIGKEKRHFDDMEELAKYS